MKKLQEYLVVACGACALALIGVSIFKCCRRCRGWGERTGRVIDASIKKTAWRIEEAAESLRGVSGRGLAANAGKSLDEAVDQAKTALDKALDIIRDGIGSRS